MINVAVLGYGTVGSGVVEVIEKNKDMVNKKSAQELEVKYILDLRDFPGDPYEDKVIHDFNTILNDDSVALTSSRSRHWRQARASALPTRNWWPSTVPNCCRSPENIIATICLKPVWAAVFPLSGR